MHDIAIAAGYGSVRRFNDSFIKTYGRTPRDLRKAGQLANNDVCGKALTVKLPCRKPFDWHMLLEFFTARVIPAVEFVVDKRYLRTVRMEDKPGIIELQSDANNVLLTLHGIETDALFPIVQRCREVFDLDAPIREINDVLSKD